MERPDVVIVGGGVMGTAAARALSARGRAVTLLERFTFGHGSGSSGGSTRNFRLTYHDPVYVRMAREALARWRRLESDAGVELLRVVGGLDVGAATDLSAAALEAAGESFERPSAAEVAERWPILRFDGATAFVYQSEGAILRADEAIGAQARLARETGAELRERTAVDAVRPSGEGVEIVTSDGEAIRASTAIVTAGAWAAPLLGGAGIHLSLRPTLEQSTHFDAGEEGSSIPTVIDWDSAPQQPPYLVPNPFRVGEIKAGAHLSGPVIDPDARSFEPDVDREAHTVMWVGEHLASRPPILRTETCLYTTTPDEDFVIDRTGPLVIGSPCSGHGFKFAPLIGEALADLATGEQPPVPLDRFRMDRPGLRV
ncbi:MAG: FAD-dependent oxidoreductase [Actinobacteria bacterium]|nr:FAD-dependent oxidoreductase [Actinomycetota bacterium]